MLSLHLYLLYSMLIIKVSAGPDINILLESPDTLLSLLEDLRNSLVEPKPRAHVRSGTNHNFVCLYKNPAYYLPRCFPSLNPYGRGCPSDKHCQNMSMAKYIKHILPVIIDACYISCY
jgi:hypothetical protein